MSAAIEMMLTAVVLARGAWVYSAVALAICNEHGWRKPRLARWLFHEIRPFYLPAVLITTADWSFKGKLLGWHALFAALALLAWYWYKDVDEDDRWKRRRRKAAELIARVGARLVVVPAGVR